MKWVDIIAMDFSIVYAYFSRTGGQVKAVLWYHTLDTSFVFPSGPTAPTLLTFLKGSETKTDHNNMSLLFMSSRYSKHSSPLTTTRPASTYILPTASCPCYSHFSRSCCNCPGRKAFLLQRWTDRNSERKSPSTYCFSSTSTLPSSKVRAHQYMSAITGNHHGLSSAKWRRRAGPHAATFGFKRGAHQGGTAAAAQRGSLPQVRPCACRGKHAQT